MMNRVVISKKFILCLMGLMIGQRRVRVSSDRLFLLQKFYRLLLDSMELFICIIQSYCRLDTVGTNKCTIAKGKYLGSDLTVGVSIEFR